MKLVKHILRVFIGITLLALVIGCRNNNEKVGPVKMTPTNMPELPYMLEGDYTPECNVMYKVLIEGDTCFVMIDSLDSKTMKGHYYKLVDGSETVEEKPFEYDSKWRDRRRDATVYMYQEPEYETADDELYRKPRFKVRVKRDVEYGQALGYWCSNTGAEEESYLNLIVNNVAHSIRRTTQSLTMDVYSPITDDSIPQRRPLLLLLHGGAFYVGDKEDTCIRALCRYFARTGYVTVSANYRMGFLPTKDEISRAGYMALQDAHAAMRYLVDHANEYHIDTSMLFVGGASAGAITALNLAFMRDKDKPKAAKKWFRNLGDIASSGNSSKATFHIKGVANMWGAVNNLNILENDNSAIISFHGDHDKIVPYDCGYPFSDISQRLGKMLFDKMYGSAQITPRAKEKGLNSRLYTYKGEGHSLHKKSDGSWNQSNWVTIRDRMNAFFYDEIVGPQPQIVADSNDRRHYYINDTAATNISWQAEGGFILRVKGRDIWVVWRRGDSVKQQLKASGINRRGFGFNTNMTIQQRPEITVYTPQKLTSDKRRDSK
ncbi:MAG: carboxylesterase family protein [Bacteroidales bacterium]|nr:carboxylesterase family protein [Bacteroidales bacterium]